MTVLCVAEVGHDTNFTIYKNNKIYYFSAERFYNYKKSNQLGHRSFLMNPSIVNGKDFINDKIKHREWWRPFGGSIIKTDVLKQYVPSNLDKYMLRSFEFKDEFKEKFQSIIHVDNTSRLQIADNSNSVFYKLINEFYKLTGIPGVLNTSYNLRGYPIANTRDKYNKSI